MDDPIDTLPFVPTRRRFLVLVVSALVAADCVGATAEVVGQKLDESDASARAFGYRQHTASVDAQKYPRHSADQRCSGCALYRGQPGDAWGLCGVFMGKLVSGDGWCAAWVRPPS